jgi:hypothetical protein
MSLDGFTFIFKNKAMSALFVVVALATPAYAESVVPNFSRGTITAETKTRTEIVETIRQIEYTTGTSYTVSGTNINIPGTPAPGANYSIVNQGAPFQFSETILGTGVAKETWIDRTTTQDSTTNSTSVFTQ